MILWTIQTIDAWAILQRTGKLYNRFENIDRDFWLAYEWMVQQMQKRLPIDRPDDNAFPVWAWYQYESKQKRRPDLRSSGFFPKGTKGVRIEFEINEKMVLLSDFELWHYVLNYWYLPVSWADGIAFEEKLVKKGIVPTYIKQSLDRKLDEVIRSSWERIFDLDWIEEDITPSREQKSIQATFWELTINNVLRIDEFVAR